MSVGGELAEKAADSASHFIEDQPQIPNRGKKGFLLVFTSKAVEIRANTESLLARFLEVNNS